MIPKFTPVDLQRLLEVLPGPTTLEVFIHDPRKKPIDYADFFRRLDEEVPAMRDMHGFADRMSVSFRPYYPSKEATLRLYTASYERSAALHQAIRPEGRRILDFTKIGVNVTEIEWNYMGKVPHAEEWEQAGAKYPSRVTLLGSGVYLFGEEESPLLDRAREALRESAVVKHFVIAKEEYWHRFLNNHL